MTDLIKPNKYVDIQWNWGLFQVGITLCWWKHLKHASVHLGFLSISVGE
jgi:hypothetical protein